MNQPEVKYALLLPQWASMKGASKAAILMGVLKKKFAEKI